MVYFFIANGFEEIEALCPLDLLRRVGIEVRTVGVGGREITGSHGITVKTDMTDAEYSDGAPELVFLPGGMPGTLNLAANETVRGAVMTAYENGAYVAAICAAPMILGELGILRGREAICYPGFEDKLTGARISDKRTVADGKVLTAAGMGVSLDFGLLIVEKLLGEETADNLRRTVIAD
ncbi:MAG: DJ-1/PfpI family protein [Clostridia bacterium]|nr:DJ-1/PfpI family protein [Clostridia bacterium]